MVPVRYTFIEDTNESMRFKGIFDSERSELAPFACEFHNDIIRDAADRLNKGTLARTALVWSPSA